MLVSDFDDKLLMPSVRESEDICQLHQHVWATTGINVEVSQLAFASDRHHIYKCSMDDTLNVPEKGLSLPNWRDEHLVEKIHPVNVFQIRAENLKHGKDLAPLREAYVTAIANINKDQ